MRFRKDLIHLRKKFETKTRLFEKPVRDNELYSGDANASKNTFVVSQDLRRPTQRDTFQLLLINWFSSNIVFSDSLLNIYRECHIHYNPMQKSSSRTVICEIVMDCTMYTWIICSVFGLVFGKTTHQIIITLMLMMIVAVTLTATMMTMTMAMCCCNGDDDDNDNSTWQW